MRVRPVDHRGDVAVVAVCLAVAAGLAAATWTRQSPPVAVPDAVAGGIACLLLTARHRAPVLLAVLLVPVDLVSFSGTPAYLVAVAAVAARRPPGVAVAVASLHLVAVVVGARLDDADEPSWQVAVVAVVALAAAVAVGLYLGARRALVASLQERARRLEDSRARDVARAREAERLRIAGEMHDVLAHRLSLVSLHAGALQLRTADADADTAAAAVLVRETAQTAVQELRDVIGVLHRPGTGADAAVAPPPPTLRDIAALVEGSRVAGVPVDLELRLAEPDLVRCPDTLGRHAHRVVQEALTNVHKHTDRASTQVVVTGAPGDDLGIEVRSRLDPSSPARGAGNGLGLVSLEERVRTAGGVFAAGREGDEFVVRARWRWP